MYEIFIGNKHN